VPVCVWMFVLLCYIDWMFVLGDAPYSLAVLGKGWRCLLEGLTAPVSLRQCAVAEGGVSRLQGMPGMPGIPCSDMPVI